MSDSLEALLEDMGRARPYDALTPFYSRLKSLVQDGVPTDRSSIFHIEDLVRGVEADWDARAVIAKMADALAAGFRSRDQATLRDSHEKARELIVKVRRMPHPDRPVDGPETVTSAQVPSLPKGSLVVGAGAEARPAPGAVVLEVGQHSRSWPFAMYVVLYRAPEKPVAVGDEITGARANTLPEGSIVKRVGPGADMYPLTKARTKARDGYRNGEYDSVPDLLVDAWTFRVLYLPEGK